MNLDQKCVTALKMVEQAPILSYDTETSGVDWKRNFPVGYVFGTNAKDAFYIPIRHGGGGNIPAPSKFILPETATADWNIHPFEKDLAKAFKMRSKSNTRVTVGHNLKFDCHLSANAKIMLGRNLSCTQNNQALIDEYSKSFSLDKVAKEYGVTAKRADDMYRTLADHFGCAPDKKSMAHFWEMPGNDDMVDSYASGDGITTYEVYIKQMERIKEENLLTVQDVENRLIWTLFRMERRGIKIDEEYLSDARDLLEERIADAYRILPDGFNPRSPVHVRKYVEQYATDWPTTPKGNPSFTEKWLKTFPEGGNIIAVRKLSNLVNSFIDPLQSEHIFEGRVHATLNQNKTDDHGTISGRLSCSYPNLQQVPKHDKELAMLFRKAFEADSGYVFYEADYSQCEPRLFAHYSQETSLLDGYMADPPKDVHTIVAEMFNKDRATTAKRMNMGMFTGMFPKAFAGHMGIELGEATELWNKWFKTFPGIKDFQDQAKRVMLSRGFVRTLLGRRGRLDTPRFAYKAVSKIIQGGNADIIKYKMVEIDEEIEPWDDDIQLLMTVHDSFVWQARRTKTGRQLSERVREIMLDVQSDPFNLRLPFAVDFDRGKNWSEASFGVENDV